MNNKTQKKSGPRLPATVRYSWLLALSLGATHGAQAQTVITKANTATLTAATDWLPNQSPTNLDIGRFDSTISSVNAAALSLGANVTLAGLQFSNNLGGPVTISGAGTLALDGSQVTSGAGLDLSAANQNVTLNSPLQLNGFQAWKAAAARTLALGGTLVHTGAGVDFSGFAGTLAGLTPDASGILGPWATTGSGTTLSYATVSGGVVGPYTGGTVATAGGVSSATVNYTLAGAVTLNTTSIANTLQYTGANAALGLTAGDPLTLSGLLNSGTGTLSVGADGGAPVTIGASQELVIAGNIQSSNTIFCPIVDNAAGPSSVTFNGPGTLVLGKSNGATTTDTSSTFTGNFVINAGTVSVQKGVNISAASPTISSPLGDRAIARNVIVNDGAILSFDSGNELGRGAGDVGAGAQLFPLLNIVVNKGGTLRATVSNRTLGPVTLNGGTVTNGVAFVGTGGANFQGLGLSGDVLVGGTSPSTISGGGINLTAATTAGQTRTFTVNDATGDANIDLTVSAHLANIVNSTVAVGLTKAGAGTMLLSSINYYTGPTIVSAGTLIAGTNSVPSTPGALGSGTTTVFLGDANTAANNSSPALLTAGAVIIGRAITVSNEPTAGTYAIGGATASNSVFAGLITVNQPLTLTQVLTVGTNALNITDGITSGGGSETLTLAGPGNISVNTVGITDGSGILAVNVTGGTNVFSAANVYSGGTVVSGGALYINGSISGGVTGNAGSLIGGSGAIGGNVTTSGRTYPGAGGATNTIDGGITYNTGSEADFYLGSSAALGGNDQIVLPGGGTALSIAGGINVGIVCGTNLDISGQSYVLCNLTGGGAISGTFNSTPLWLAATPNFASFYKVVNTGTQIVLQYSGPSGPSITAANATPNPALRGQAVFVSVTVSPGAGPITSVKVDVSSVGGSSTQALVADGAGDYTNTVVVAPGIAPGAKTLTVTATDNNSYTAHVGISLAVIGSQEVWGGGGANNNWSSGLNWSSGTPPGLSGDSVTFSGTTRLSPVMDNSYSLGSVTFDGTAGGFNISAVAGDSLTLTGNVTNDSASTEVLNVPVTLAVPVTISALAGNLNLGQNLTNGGNLLTISDGGFNTVINGGVVGSGGLTKTGTGTGSIMGNNGFTGPTTVSAGTLALWGSNAPTAITVQAGAALQLGGSNAVTGLLHLANASTLQLRGDSNTTFTNGGIVLDTAVDTNNFDVGSVSGTATGETLTLFGPLAYLNNSPQRINVTGAASYTLGLGDITTTTTTTQGYVYDINTVPGSASVTIASFTAGNFGNYVNFSGGGKATVKGKIGNTSNGGDALFVNDGTTVTLQGPSQVTSNPGANADGYHYMVQNGTLVIDNSNALTNNTSGAEIKLSQFILGPALMGNASGSGLANGGDTSSLVVTNDNSYNCAVYLGDTNFPSGGITVGPEVTNIVSDGGFVTALFSTFLNTGIMTIGGQNTSGANTFANPIILGYQTSSYGGYDGGESVTVVATAGGEVDFTGGILQNGGDTTAAVTVGDSLHSGLVKFAGTTDTYPGGTTVAYGTLLVNNTIGTGSSSVTVNSGANLGGNGTILDAATVQSGGTLQPGLGSGDTTALIIDNSLTLNGNTVFTLNRGNSPNSSQVTGLTTLTEGGTLTVTNAGAPLQAGDTFTLFSAASIAGGFDVTNLPSLPSGLAWSDNVALDGTISVIAVTVPGVPTIGSPSIAGGNITFSGINGPAGQSYRILTTTNLAQPVNNWIPIATNTFAANGGYTNTFPVVSGPGQRFFLLVTP